MRQRKPVFGLWGRQSLNLNTTLNSDSSHYRIIHPPSLLSSGSLLLFLFSSLSVLSSGEVWAFSSSLTRMNNSKHLVSEASLEFICLNRLVSPSVTASFSLGKRPLCIKLITSTWLTESFARVLTWVFVTFLSEHEPMKSRRDVISADQKWMNSSFMQIVLWICHVCTGKYCLFQEITMCSCSSVIQTCTYFGQYRGQMTHTATLQGHHSWLCAEYFCSQINQACKYSPCPWLYPLCETATYLELLAWPESPKHLPMC